MRGFTRARDGFSLPVHVVRKPSHTRRLASHDDRSRHHATPGSPLPTDAHSPKRKLHLLQAVTPWGVTRFAPSLLAESHLLQVLQVSELLSPGLFFDLAQQE